MREDSTGQSEVIGVILILAISITSIAIILLLGQPVLSDATNDATVDRVQNEILTLDSRLTAASLGTSVNESVALSLEGGQLTSDSDATRLNVTLADGTTVYNSTIGKIEYENGNTAIAYEAGGVWRRNTVTGASSMVASPDFDFDGETMTLPVYNVTTDVSYSGSPTLSVRGGNNTRKFPNSTHKNPVDGAVVTVDTEYYRAWERYIEEELRGNATVDEDANEIRAELPALDAPGSIDWAGASKTEYGGPRNGLFGSFEEGVKFPSVDEDIESYVEYAEGNRLTGQGSGPVTDLWECTPCDSSDPVVYNDTDYVMDGEKFDTSMGNITVVVDGDLTVKDMDLTSTGSNTNLRIVTTGDLEMSSGYTVTNPGDPEKLIFQTTSDGEVVFEGGNGGSTGTGTGTVYAPDSLVSLSEMGEGSGSEWTGPVVAKTFDATGVDSDARIELGSSVSVERADDSVNLYITERNVGIEG